MIDPQRNTEVARPDARRLKGLHTPGARVTSTQSGVLTAPWNAGPKSSAPRTRRENEK